MTRKSPILDVLYQSNDNYAMVSGISIASLLENNKHLDRVNIYYCDYQISKDNRDRLKSLVGKYKNSKLQLIDTSSYHKTLLDLQVKPWHGVYVTWLKLLAVGDLSIDTDRILFLNGHTIINGALDDLIEIDLGDNVMALSYDCLINSHKYTIGLDGADSYYNCGIMLINHTKWKKEDISEKIKSHLRNKSDYQIADQDLCNVLFRGQITTLGSTYNFSSAYYAYDIKKLLAINNLRPEYFYTYEELMENYHDPKIIHSLFGIKGKPWEEGNEHPNKYLWKKYINVTPWSDVKPPVAQRSINWFLYDILPNRVFLLLYKIGVKRKFTK
jgi:lipopolysaccharide biosynthesis glycosyltransferase